jgi:hypothetical protein
MTSDPGDYIGNGRSWSDGPPEKIKVTAARNRFQFFIDTSDGGWWDGTIEAPNGQDLTATTYKGAQRFGGDGYAGLDIGGMGRGCNQVTGQFTVREIVFDASGTLRTFKVDFEQHCEGALSALRGTLEFQSA